MHEFRINCGECKKAAGWDSWQRGQHPDTFKCPNCGYKFRRVKHPSLYDKDHDKWTTPWIEMVKLAKELPLKFP